MEKGRGQKRAPCANKGCKDPDTDGGQWNWLTSIKDLAAFDIREGAVCWCNKRGCREYFKGDKKRKLKDMFQGSVNDPCLPKQYKVRKIKEIWGVRYTNLSKMNPQERGNSLDKFRFEYIVYGNFLCKSPYILATSAYWVPLSKLVKNVTRAKAVAEIEIFEGNMEAHRSDELDELESEDDEEDDE